MDTVDHRLEKVIRPDPATDVLDDPVGAALRGRQATWALRRGRVARFSPEMATFAAVPVDATSDDWSDLGHLLGPGALADLFCGTATPPDGWEPVFDLDGLQMVVPAASVGSPPVDPAIEVCRLGRSDVPDMMALVARTRPGPFWERTQELGSFVGIRENGMLVAMAGERLRPPGWTEISSVCSDPLVRGRGYAGTLIHTLIAGIQARGERPFLHLAADNTSALRLYQRCGFTIRTTVTFRGFRVPDSLREPAEGDRSPGLVITWPEPSADPMRGGCRRAEYGWHGC